MRSALVALNKGFFTKNLGDGVTLKTSIFSSGTEETTALLAGQLDAAYVGPNPAINAWQKSSGKAIKIISGAASGGAALVVKPSISSVSQLKGQKVATPSLGNTQDVALRYYLKQHGLTTTQTGGGDVAVTPIKPNSDAVLEFKSGQIAGRLGAWPRTTPRWSRTAARSWSTRPACGRAASSSPPTSSSPRPSSPLTRPW